MHKGLHQSIRLLLVWSIIHLPLLHAQEVQENKVAGRVLNIEQDDGISDALVRLVDINTGVAREVYTNKEGCYDFEKVPIGTYAVSVTYQEKEYLYPDRLAVVKTEYEKTLFKRCFSLIVESQLLLLKDSECTTCKAFSAAWLVVGAAGIGSVLGVAGAGEEASPSVP